MKRSAGSVAGGASFGRLFADPVHGPLPALMLVLTVLTGVVDAVSILSLGRVFVANMTGNVVFAAITPARCAAAPAAAINTFNPRDAAVVAYSWARAGVR